MKCIAYNDLVIDGKVKPVIDRVLADQAVHGLAPQIGVASVASVFLDMPARARVG